MLVHEAGFQGAPERQVAFVPALLETEGENRPHPSLLGRRDQVLLSSNSLSRLFALPLTTAILRASPASAVALRAAAQACGVHAPGVGDELDTLTGDFREVGLERGVNEIGRIAKLWSLRPCTCLQRHGDFGEVVVR